MNGERPLIRMRGIARRFGSVHAVRGADFACGAGEIHALPGENGAGKSTLVNILFELLPPGAGEIRLGGRAVRFRSPADAMAAGLGMVHQHFTHAHEGLWSWVADSSRNRAAVGAQLLGGTA